MYIQRANKFFTWNGTLVGRGNFYGYYDGKAFVSDGVRLQNNTMIISYRIKNNWVTKMYPIKNIPLAKILNRRYRDEYNARESMKEAIAKAGPYHSMAYVPQKKHSLVF